MSPAVSVAVIVVAAGAGSRLGAGEPKAFVRLAGVPILARALETVFGMAEAAQVIVVAPQTHLSSARSLAENVAGAAKDHVTVVAGGQTRQQSVAAGLAALEASVSVVLVHDAARCLTPSSLFERVARAVTETGEGVIPVLEVTDTIKRLGEAGTVESTLDRDQLVRVQTPQGFPRQALTEAYANARREYTDDAALVADAGLTVRTIQGSSRAFKITEPWDLRRAEQAVAPDRSGGRVGLGIDVHVYDESRPLWLGGLYWPDEPGLAGHSDGDAIAHAMCDALLSAAGLGDIGSRFGVSDERFENAHADVFVRTTVDLVTGAGYTIRNVAVQLVGNQPRLAGRRLELENHLTQLVGAPVSVAATTSDGLGFTGRGEGLSVVATALLDAAR